MKNKDKIKREALYLFAENGFDKTGIRDIAQKVGIRESAIYNHYKSKTEIFLALLDDAKNRLTATRYIDDEMLEKLANPQEFLEILTERIIRAWSDAEDKAYTKLLIQSKFNSSVKSDFKFDELFSNLRKLLEIIFTQLKTYGFVKDLPVKFLVESYISPLIVIKLKFLINDFFDYEHVLTEARENTKFFWEQIRTK